MPREIRSLLFAVLLVSAGGSAGAVTVDRGESLHAAHCQRCHDASVYTRTPRLVNTLAELRDRVKACELANDLLWFDEEVNAVSAYLNGHFYLFGIK